MSAVLAEFQPRFARPTSKQLDVPTFDIAVAIDDDLVMPCCVMMTSILENLYTDKAVRFFVLTAGLKDESVRQIETTLSAYAVELHIVDKESASWLDYPACHLGSVPEVPATVAAKLSLDTLLPPDVNRVLMLNTDIVVRANLAELYDTPLNGRPVGAVLDGYYPYLGLAETEIVSRARLDPYVPYFNAGVMLVDLPVWRHRRLSQLSWAVLGQYYKFAKLNEQTILNLAVDGDFVHLPPRWNFIKALLSYPCSAASPYDDLDYRVAVRNPSVIHYVGKHKPWYSDCRHPWRREFYRYLSRSQLANFSRTPCSWISKFAANVGANDLPKYRMILNLSRLSNYSAQHKISAITAWKGFLYAALKRPRILIAPFIYPMLLVAQSIEKRLNTRRSENIQIVEHMSKRVPWAMEIKNVA